MKGIRVREILIKYLTSILFRLILVFYGIFLLIIQENIVNIYMYIVLIIVYFFTYLYLIKGKRPFLRMINDYLFILFILFDKDVSQIYNFLFILLPIINSPNHTQEKRRQFILVLITMTIFIILDFRGTNILDFKDYIYISTALIFIILITLFEYYRSQNTTKLFNIYSEIDEIASKKAHTSQVPEIYKYLIEKYNHQLKFDIENIIGFQYHGSNNNKVIVRNSSVFIHSYKISTIIKEVEKKQVSYNQKIKLNNEEYKFNFSIKIDGYIFLFLVKKEIETNSLKRIFMESTIFGSIVPILNKLIKIIELENLLKKQKYNATLSLNKKSQYVNNVMKSTHYLSNQFSPITNYFDLIDKYKMLEETNKKEKLEIIIDDEGKNAKRCLKNIKEKSLNILDNDMNPFVPRNIKKIKYKYIYMSIKSLWLEEFDEKDIFLYNDDKSNELLESDSQVLEFIFTDIIENIRKYSHGKHTIKFSYENNLSIEIVNNIKDIKRQKKTISEIIKNFNNEDRSELSKENNFGLSHIQELAHLLKIKIILKLDKENNFIMILTFLRREE
ncbi:MAG: Unknown protein [uncultured Sulfurovum sp.]|uniref:Uncharacterized protein n=1 Tax=uncultured Sulfurovum sp. TaxID=269237 RepID=A0A6S6TXN6_9BACT|nr:MAG: Unknown protein [uncultured Sulfurovum sp.]